MIDSNTVPEIGVVMGSHSDWKTMKHCTKQLQEFDLTFETKVVSAHRTPDLLFEYAAKAKSRGLKVIIAAAGGSAHLPGMLAAKTTLPIIGVPIQSRSLNGLDSLLSIVQMPAGIPVATVAIGEAGAKNAALLAISLLALSNQKLADQLEKFRHKQSQKVLLNPNPSQ